MNDHSFPTDLAQIQASPLWHFHDYDLTRETFSLMRIDEGLFRSASFLDERIYRHNLPKISYELQHLSSLFPPSGVRRPPIAIIFHIGHCGSTLLSRALASSELVLPIREPLCLRSLANDKRELNTPTSLQSPTRWQALFTAVMDALARTFRPDQLNVIKATSICNNLLTTSLEEDDKSRIVLMFIPLHSYLAAMLGKPEPATDLRRQAKTRMRDWTMISDSVPLELYRLSYPQLGVLSWISNMNYFMEAIESHPQRLILLDFDKLLADPETELTEVTEHLCISSSTGSVVKGFDEVSSSYSKTPNVNFTPADRQELLQRAHREKADEIHDGMRWAEQLMKSVPSLARCAAYLR